MNTLQKALSTPNRSSFDTLVQCQPPQLVAISYLQKYSRVMTTCLALISNLKQRQLKDT